MAPEPGRAHGGQFEGARANSGLKGTAANLSLFILFLSTSKSVPFQPNSYNYSRRFFCLVSAHSSLLGWADSPRTISFFILLLPPFSANQKVLQFSPLALFLPYFGTTLITHPRGGGFLKRRFVPWVKDSDFPSSAGRGVVATTFPEVTRSATRNRWSALLLIELFAAGWFWFGFILCKSDCTVRRGWFHDFCFLCTGFN